MTSRPTPPPDRDTEAPPSEAFAAFIAYEDLPSGLAARRCLDPLLRELGSNVRLTLWRLDLLQEGELAASAVQDAASADLVLLSLRGAQPLSSAAKQWLGAWLEQRGDREGALGVLLEREGRRTQTAAEILSFLQWATQRRPVDLFAGYFQATNSDPNPAFKDNRPRAGFRKPAQDGLPHRPGMPSSHWGINE